MQGDSQDALLLPRIHAQDFNYDRTSFNPDHLCMFYSLMDCPSSSRVLPFKHKPKFSLNGYTLITIIAFIHSSIIHTCTDTLTKCAVMWRPQRYRKWWLQEVTATSQEAVLVGDEGEAVEGVVGAGAGVELGGPAHRAGDHLSGELGVDVLGVCRSFLEGFRMKYKLD